MWDLARMSALHSDKCGTREALVSSITSIESVSG